MREDVIEELRSGQLVTLPLLKHGGKLVQRRLLDLLQKIAGDVSIVDVNLPFRALPEYEVRGAMVAVVAKERCEAIRDDDYLYGSPELIVEILFESHIQSQLREEAALCLATGSEES